MSDAAEAAPTPVVPTTTMERLADDVRWGFPKSDYARGFNDGIDALIARLGEAEGRPERTNLPSNAEIRDGFRWAAPRAEGLDGIDVPTLREMIGEWIDEGFTTPPYTSEQYDIFEALGIFEPIGLAQYDVRRPSDERGGEG